MSTQFQFRHLLFIIVPVTLAVTALSWNGTKKLYQNKNQNTGDTIPSKHKDKSYFKINKDEKDLDKAIKELDKAEEKLDGKMEDIDWDKIDRDIEKSMKNLDVEMSRHDLDMEKMDKDIEKSMKDIDVEKIKKRYQRCRETGYG